MKTIMRTGLSLFFLESVRAELLRRVLTLSAVSPTSTTSPSGPDSEESSDSESSVVRLLRLDSNATPGPALLLKFLRLEGEGALFEGLPSTYPPTPSSCNFAEQN